jgi:hypothetical protein
MLRDRRLWVFAAANALSMVGYFFWFFWTSKYMVDVYRLTLQAGRVVRLDSAGIRVLRRLPGRLALPAIGGARVAAPAARFRVCLAAAVVSLATAALPWAPSPAWASAGISLSIFAVAAFSVNMYTCRWIPSAPRRRGSPFPFWCRAMARFDHPRPGHRRRDRRTRILAGDGGGGVHAAGGVRRAVVHEVHAMKQCGERGAGRLQPA